MPQTKNESDDKPRELNFKAVTQPLIQILKLYSHVLKHIKAVQNIFWNNALSLVYDVMAIQNN